MLVIGVMSGTSADGIEVALARVEEGKEKAVASGGWRVTSEEAKPQDPRATTAHGAPEGGSGAQEGGLKPPLHGEKTQDPPANSAGGTPGDGGGTQEVRRELVGHVTVAMSKAVRAEVLRVGEGAQITAGELSQLNFRVGEEFAAAVLTACKRFGVRTDEVGLIGSHGQTVFHQGKAVPFLGKKTASTLQIGEPAVIAERTGITTIGDFRVADVAAGGQGAPLVPFADWVLFGDERVGRVLLNLGGIANLTVLEKREPTVDSLELTASEKKNLREESGTGQVVRAHPLQEAQRMGHPRALRIGSQERNLGAQPRIIPQGTRDGEELAVPQVVAFDTGPANMVIDALVGRFTKGRKRFDEDARMALRGECVTGILRELMRDPYLRVKPPKSTGREYYGREFLERVVR